MNFPYEERYQAEPIVAAGNGSFTAAEIKETGSTYLYHAIHIENSGANKGKARLALDGDRVDGSFVQFEGGEAGSPLLIYSFRQKGMRFRNGGTTVISLGSKIVGSSRSGSTPEFGYVKAFSADADLSSLTLAIINTIDGSASTTEADLFKAHIENAINGAVLDQLDARGIVRGPEGAPHILMGNRSEADVIVEFGFE